MRKGGTYGSCASSLSRDSVSESTFRQESVTSGVRIEHEAGLPRVDRDRAECDEGLGGARRDTDVELHVRSDDRRERESDNISDADHLRGCPEHGRLPVHGARCPAVRVSSRGQRRRHGGLGDRADLFGVRTDMWRDSHRERKRPARRAVPQRHENEQSCDGDGNVHDWRRAGRHGDIHGDRVVHIRLRPATARPNPATDRAGNEGGSAGRDTWERRRHHDERSDDETSAFDSPRSDKAHPG